jgi:neutral ceramidase
VLPLQVVRIGQVAIVAAPGEFTIMSGRRVRAAVAAQLPEVRHVIFAGYANAYAGYVTTPEEYRAQYYEGASTHFGPWTLPAYQQEFAALAAALRTGEPTPSAAEPPDLAAGWPTVAPAGRVPDLAPPGRRLGQVARQPRPSYRPGDLAAATFHGGCPNNDTRNGSTYLEVQRDGTGGWTTVAVDDDWTTLFRWHRVLPGVSVVRVAWRIPADAEPGRYRIVHHGDALDRAGAVTPYTGVSRPFTVLE